MRDIGREWAAEESSETRPGNSGASNWYELEDITDGARQGDAFGASLSLAHNGLSLAAGSLAANNAAGVVRVFFRVEIKHHILDTRREGLK